jgi:transcription factor C subunit 7
VVPVLCTHAAVVIALGRVLTGVMPAHVDEEDFAAYTCGVSVYRRKRRRVEDGDGGGGGGAVMQQQQQQQPPRSAAEWGQGRASAAAAGSDTEACAAAAGNDYPIPQWEGGRGVRGGWTCEADSDCSFLKGGAERGW